MGARVVSWVQWWGHGCKGGVMSARVGPWVRGRDHGCKGGVMGARVGPWVAEGGVAEGGENVTATPTTNAEKMRAQ